MQLVPAHPCRSLHPAALSRSLPPLQVLRIATELLSVLKYLGSLRPPVVHRDIKPENVVLEGGTWGGRVYLIDFGGVQGTSPTGASQGGWVGGGARSPAGSAPCMRQPVLQQLLYGLGLGLGLTPPPRLQPRAPTCQVSRLRPRSLAATATWRRSSFAAARRRRATSTRWAPRCCTWCPASRRLPSPRSVCASATRTASRSGRSWQVRLVSHKKGAHGRTASLRCELACQHVQLACGLRADRSPHCPPLPPTPAPASPPSHRAA